MSNLIRWEPAREMMSLRDAMDRLFDDAFTRPLSLRDAWSVPAIDMYQTDDEIVVKAALPGIKADEVQINVTGEVLTLKGEVKHEEERRKKPGTFASSATVCSSARLPCRPMWWQTRRKPSSRTAS